MVCISCKTTHSSSFCPHCGERSGVKKITLKAITQDALTTLTNMDKGLLYNLKTLFISPKTITRDYLLGKRKGILNPISFLILTVTLYLLAEGFLETVVENTDKKAPPDLYIRKVAYAIGRYVHRYFKYFWILSIIPLAAVTKLVFRKHNFTEHLAINAFIIGQATIIGLISYIIFKIDMLINPLVYAIMLWLIYRIYRTERDKIETALMSFITIVLFILQLCLIAIAVGMAMA